MDTQKHVVGLLALLCFGAKKMVLNLPACVWCMRWSFVEYRVKLVLRTLGQFVAAVKLWVLPSVMSGGLSLAVVDIFPGY